MSCIICKIEKVTKNIGSSTLNGFVLGKIYGAKPTETMAEFYTMGLVGEFFKDQKISIFQPLQFCSNECENSFFKTICGKVFTILNDRRILSYPVWDMLKKFDDKELGL